MDPNRASEMNEILNIKNELLIMTLFHYSMLSVMALSRTVQHRKECEDNLQPGS